ncbi:TPA: LysR family transcriptional regulator [Serratia rubidaea]|uniref:LysR family transcriptional regulator n=1 Tax=Serratia rubidaea TaxID=61652 RepID=UPI0023AF8AED|nr:LysR family transcriptional regulator [Serratia rubidaea]MDK1703015.1 LysR family transcriptional regulator [Serratia rubidaea]HDJ1439075.1 LysR family transcriptional regulator [Serratia rubidaea]HDJ1450360.1 LysR family transcriptional regulator [Serratia rubidaea]HDJ1463991.1 LysR family transcriptional regulator [Serratia rubidaea]HDJ2772796.1 LysR family transcriptional regulator [Serratia rubidaea]
MNDPDFNLLAALDALLAEGSVAGAARRLGLSASAMSRTLSRLRQVTGDPLLVRAGRSMVLTPHAEQIRDRARQTLAEARALLLPAASGLDLRTLRQTFRLRTNEGFVETFGAALVTAAAQAAPEVCLRFVPKPEKSPRSLREDDIDIEVGVLHGMGPEIHLQTLFRDRFIVAVRQGHPLAAQTPVTPERYAACQHVIASRQGKRTGPVDKALAEQGLTRRIAAVTPDFSAALAIAAQSDLVALVPASFFIQKMRGGGGEKLQGLRLPVATPEITVSQMWHPRRKADPAHQWLRQLLLTVCRRQAAELHRAAQRTWPAWFR